MPQSDKSEGAAAVEERMEQEGEVEMEVDFKDPIEGKTEGAEASGGEKGPEERQTEVDVRRVRIPPHKYSQLKTHWPKIVAPVTQHLKLQIRWV
jgi:hypothetical protein